MTWNILAKPYGNTRMVANAKSCRLDWEVRIKKIQERILKDKADIVCLQEVDRDSLKKLSNLTGYTMVATAIKHRGRGKEGSLTLVRNGVWKTEGVKTVNFADGSGSLALVTYLKNRRDGLAIAVINTHLKVGHQKTQLAEIFKATGHCRQARILCGDFNLDPNAAKGAMVDGFHTIQDLFATSISPAGKPVVRDYVFVDKETQVFNKSKSVHLKSTTCLPNYWIPSDHLPVLTVFSLKP